MTALFLWFDVRGMVARKSNRLSVVDRDSFASLHLDILLAVAPALTILDGVWGMEGHGPANGEPRHLKISVGAVIKESI